MINFLNMFAALICGAATILGILHENTLVTVVGSIFTILNIMCLIYNT